MATCPLPKQEVSVRGGDQDLKEASAVSRSPSTIGSTQSSSRDPEDYKTDYKRYHRAFVVCRN